MTTGRLLKRGQQKNQDEKSDHPLECIHDASVDKNLYEVIGVWFFKHGWIID